MKLINLKDFKVEFNKNSKLIHKFYQNLGLLSTLTNFDCLIYIMLREIVLEYLSILLEFVQFTLSLLFSSVHLLSEEDRLRFETLVLLQIDFK